MPTDFRLVIKMSCLGLVGLVLMFFLTPVLQVHANEFSCSSGDVTCLINSIDAANGLPGEHTIKLAPGIYTLRASLRDPNGPLNADVVNGLPSITGSIQIQASSDDPTVIERDPSSAEPFRIFHVSVGGVLTLQGLAIQRVDLVQFFPAGGAAVFNRGVTTIDDSIITETTGDGGAVHNMGTLNVLRTTIVGNFARFEGGGIFNNIGGNLLIENSTIAHNSSADGGGLLNRGTATIKNSAIIANHTDCCQPGGGILNFGSADIINTTIARNGSGAFGGGIANIGGAVSILNSTIRENQAGFVSLQNFGGGVSNSDGVLSVQNTIIASNSGFRDEPSDCIGSITSLGTNLIGDVSRCTINLQPTDFTGDPGLGDLVEMGEDDQPGKVFYPVLPGSVVINRADPNACPAKDQLGNPRVGTCDIGAIEFQERAQVPIDVRPRSEANKVNPNSSKDINVAILSENGFDATTVDSDSVRFGATGIEASPVHVARRDVNGDGQRDLVLRFQIPALELECGASSATLTGIVNGQGIIGSAPITTTGCNKKSK